MGYQQIIDCRFRNPAGAGHTEIVKDSKFIGYCYPIKTISDAAECQEQLRVMHPKATHICWAYRLLINGQLIYHSDDDGEPRGSAAGPILQALEVRRLVNTWCGVVRYFGGAKLGIGGLIRAYGKTAGRTLDIAGAASIVLTRQVVVKVNPTHMGQMYQLLQRGQWTFRVDFVGDNAHFYIQIPEDDLKLLSEAVAAVGGVLEKN